MHRRAACRSLWRVPCRGRPEQARLLNTLGDRENDTAVERVLMRVWIETEIGWHERLLRTSGDQPWWEHDRSPVCD
jgi:hypothetical protein